MSNKKRPTSRLFSCGCRTHRFVCLNCDKPTCPRILERHNDCYCNACWERVRFGKELRYRVRCMIPGCQNYTDQGIFRGDFCAPCYNYIVTGRGTTSQAYRNELVKANLRALAALTAKKSPGSTVANPLGVLALYGKAGG